MRVIFVQDEIRDRMGIMALSAALKERGHIAEVFINQLEKDLVGSVLQERPDLLAFSTATTEHQFCLNLVDRLRANTDVPIVVGGPHPTFFPEMINHPNVDIICRGEGEGALIELVDTLEKGDDYSRIQNLWVKNDGHIIKNDLRPLIGDLDTLPIPDREIYYDRYEVLRNNPTKTFYFMRGCPFACTYCFNHTMQKLYRGKGKWVRFRSVEKSIEELKYVVNNFPTKWSQFNDDTLNINKDWLYRFLENYKKEIGLGFICNLRIDYTNEEMIDRLKEAGVNRINFGIEHGDETFRREVLKRNMSDDHIIRMGKYIRKKKIRLFTANIIGFPGESIEMAMETVRINSHFKPEFASCDILQPYPRTEIAEYAVKLDCLDETYDVDNLGRTNIAYTGKADSSYSIIRQNNIRRLENIQKFFHYMVKYPFSIRFFLLLSYLPPNRFFSHIWQLPEISKRIRFSSSLRMKIKHFVRYFIIK